VKIDRLSWTGFGIVLIGWAVLIADLVVSDATLRAGNLVTVLSLRSDIVTLAQTAILSGFGLAVVGSLRSGFGAFTRFFDAVLQRSVTPRSKEPTPLEPEPIGPEPLAPEPDPVFEADPAPSRPPEVITITPTAVEPDRPRPDRPRTDRRNRDRDRNYVILADGSVEVETMFGTRIFANMEEAKDFIR
jgi:hypothetical protein